MRYITHAVRMNLHRAMQYRASFLMQTFAQFVMTAGDLMAVLILMGRFGHAGHWSPSEILFFFGAMQITFSVTETINRGLAHFSAMIQSGSFDTVLLRPRSSLLQVTLNELDPRRFGSIAVGVAALALSSSKLSVSWTPASVLLLLWAMLGTVALLMGLFLIEAIVCFFSVQSIEIVNILTYGGRAACEYPVDVFPSPVRLLFTYVAPIALCLHEPISFILGRPVLALPAAAVWVCPVAGFLFFFLMILLWCVGVRHYRSTGS